MICGSEAGTVAGPEKFRYLRLSEYERECIGNDELQINDHR